MAFKQKVLNDQRYLTVKISRVEDHKLNPSKFPRDFSWLTIRKYEWKKIWITSSSDCKYHSKASFLRKSFLMFWKKESAIENRCVVHTLWRRTLVHSKMNRKKSWGNSEKSCRTHLMWAREFEKEFLQLLSKDTIWLGPYRIRYP